MLSTEQIAVWCGLTPKKNLCDCTLCQSLKFINPDKPECGMTTPDFLNSMDACIKWIIPKLRETGLSVKIYSAGNFISYQVFICRNYGQQALELNGIGDTMSEAFCTALSKLVEGKE